MIRPGDRIEVHLRTVVHGGAVIAAIADDEQRRTVFVRHGLPGERGVAEVTAVRSAGRIIFADLVEVEERSPDRVEAPCPYSGPGGCGGCDLQHVALDRQRSWKAEVLADSLRRIAKLDPTAVPWDQQVHPVPGDLDGLRWRTRGRFLSSDGRLAMQRHRSRQTVLVDDCLITASDVVAAARAALKAGTTGEISAVAASGGEVMAGSHGSLHGRQVRERVAGTNMHVAATGFWQVHPGAPEALLGVVARALAVRPTDVLLDLYGGVGLFAAVLGPQAGGVHLVEGDRTAARLARGNLAAIGNAQVHCSDVEAWLKRYRGAADAVVLDPPRSGAGAGVIGELHRLQPRAVAYVACDPAAFARDLRTAAELGWRLHRLTAFDLFPMTHHLECVAWLLPDGGSNRPPS
jgi:tRNA/tmRNA/rRNA uracil-C5-methylase (TrmA/RlmC/RlmD family)